MLFINNKVLQILLFNKRSNYTLFYKHSVLKVSLDRLTKLFILVLFYAYNMLSKIEYVVTVL